MECTHTLTHGDLCKTFVRAKPTVYDVDSVSSEVDDFKFPKGTCFPEPSKNSFYSEDEARATGHFTGGNRSLAMCGAALCTDPIMHVYFCNMEYSIT